MSFNDSGISRSLGRDESLDYVFRKQYGEGEKYKKNKEKQKQKEK